MNVAVIPARGGSKRIPRKNIKLFHGKPMIAWSIEAALKSGCFDRILVSTDDPEIAGIAKKWGAEAPFIRPSDLSDDYTGTVPVIGHAVNWMRQQSIDVDYVCCIYATAPFLRGGDLGAGLELIKSSTFDYVFSATEYGFPIQRAIKLNSQGRVHMFCPEHLETRSQDLEAAWHDAGQFYWGTPEAWAEHKGIFGPRSTVVNLPRYLVQDIDTVDDWVRAEYMYDSLLRSGDI